MKELLKQLKAKKITKVSEDNIYEAVTLLQHRIGKIDDQLYVDIIKHSEEKFKTKWFDKAKIKYKNLTGRKFMINYLNYLLDNSSVMETE